MYVDLINKKNANPNHADMLKENSIFSFDLQYVCVDSYTFINLFC